MKRRDFIKTTAVGVSAAAVWSLSDKDAKAVAPSDVTRWDYEADVVVVGAGFAAQAAAITAHDAGASVLMLEKASEHDQGGNSRVCGQGFVAPSPAIWEGYTKYLRQATTGQGYPQSDEWIQFFLEEGYKNRAWFEGMGAKIGSAPPPFGQGGWIPFFPQFPGADAVASEPSFYWVTGSNTGAEPGTATGGANWLFLEGQINRSKGIKKMYETPAKSLVQNPETKEILGVVAVSLWETYPRDIYIKAKRAVCVCNGGYEFDQKMIRDFIHIPAFLSQGSPYNTGDGIKMCMAAGADLRNMGAFAAPAGLACRFPQYKANISYTFPPRGAAIQVGANNKRWRDEYRAAATGIQNKEKAHLEGSYNSVGSIIENGVYVRDKYPMPMHVIFDETARLAGRFFSSSGAGFGWVGYGIEEYKCSADNSAEIAMGWITKGDTIEELATKLGREPDALMGRVPLQQTIDTWNASCAAGKDLEFDKGDPNFTAYGRPATRLVPFTAGPYYGVEIFPSCLNTQGGMVRNLQGQVLDKEGNPIPRLYAAGENGGFWNHLYQCMSNVGADCYAGGRMAGQTAADETPWS
jgi:succinate dehydrogenase/fumarate reductase flavoprotein subunit